VAASRISLLFIFSPFEKSITTFHNKMIASRPPLHFFPMRFVRSNSEISASRPPKFRSEKWEEIFHCLFWHPASRIRLILLMPAIIFLYTRALLEKWDCAFFLLPGPYYETNWHVSPQEMCCSPRRLEPRKDKQTIQNSKLSTSMLFLSVILNSEGRKTCILTPHLTLSRMSLKIDLNQGQKWPSES